jgi:hypothetical protein
MDSRLAGDLHLTRTMIQPPPSPIVHLEPHSGNLARARRFGASVLLAPREGPAGWRSVIAVPEGGEMAFWQPKTPGSRSSAPELR